MTCIAIANCGLPTPTDSLDLWWQFEAVVHGQVPDLAGKGHTGTLTPPARVQPMGAAPAPARPRSRLDEEGLGRLANLKRLMEALCLPMDRSDCAVARDPPHRPGGRTDTVGRHLQSDGHASAWPFHIDQPLRWDVSGATWQEQSRQIRSRLMGALRISHDNLNLLVVALSGQGESFLIEAGWAVPDQPVPAGAAARPAGPERGRVRALAGADATAACRLAGRAADGCVRAG